MDFKQKVVELISSQVELPKEKINSLIERPKNPEMGDYAFPAFILAKTLHKNPAEIAKDIVANLADDNFEKIQAVGPYVNFSIKKSALISQTLEEVLVKKNNYGNQTSVVVMLPLICLVLTLLSQCQWVTFVQL